MKPSFAIGIPTINRYDLLKNALKRYETDFPDVKIYIIDNGHQGVPEAENIIISTPPKNIGVAASWNRLCDSIFNLHDHAIIINDDVEWGKDQDEVEYYLGLNKKEHGFFCSLKETCLFVLPKKTYTLVGQFDEKFYPAYFEDNDYKYRLKLKGSSIVYDQFFDPVVYRNSMTIQKDVNLGWGYMDNRNYYVQKWGGLPGNELFTVPFNHK